MNQTVWTMNGFPKVGIRPIIDGRRRGVRESLEVQTMNTGLAGFKTAGVSSIPERLGGQEYRDLHSGGSKFVNV